MIRINLLPFRAARKRENIKRQISIFALVLLLLFAGMGYQYYDLSSELSEVKAEQKKVKKELRSYNKILRKIKTLNKRIKALKAKLRIIKQLEKGKTGPVLLLDQISSAVPKNKLWISSLKQKKKSLRLTGTAMDNATVALFMDNLKRSKQISTVNLQSVKLRNIKKYKLRVSDFVLKCNLAAPKKKKSKKGKKKGR
jgi:type IV pilus assembly protein PilN